MTIRLIALYFWVESSVENSLNEETSEDDDDDEEDDENVTSDENDGSVEEEGSSDEESGVEEESSEDNSSQTKFRKEHMLYDTSNNKAEKKIRADVSFDFH